MDKYEFNIKVEQLKKLVGKNDYETAMKIADTIDWRRVRNTNLLSMVAMVYEKNEDYEEAREILLLAYERAPIGKRLLYKLAELAIKEGNIEEAESYYREFSDLAPDDPRQQLLRYMILKEKGAPAQQLIHSLESYTSEELDERWLYELAELYSLAGMADQCVATCDKIMLMFGLGKYVEKAMELKIQYAPLTTYQMDLVENRDKYEEKLRAVEEEYRIGGNGAMQEPEEEYYDEPEDGFAEDGYPAEGNNGYADGGYAETGYDNGGYVQEDYGDDSYAAGGLAGAGYADSVLPTEDDYENGMAETSALGTEDPAGEEMNFAEAFPTGEQYNGYEDPRDIDEKLKAQIQEAEVQERLARELSKIADQEPVEDLRSQSSTGAEATRVLEDIRRVRRPVSDIAGKAAAVQAAASAEERMPAPPVSAASEIPSRGERITPTMPRPHGTVYIPEEEEKVSEPLVEEEEEPVLDIQDLDEDEEPEETGLLNHLMIESRTPEKGLSVAVEALKQIHKETGAKNPVARISGSKLSKRGVAASADKLAGKDLIIEEAGDLTPKALDELNEMMNQDTADMVVVLIDNPKQMESLHSGYPVLASKFEYIGCQEETISPAAGFKEAADKEPLSEEELSQEESLEEEPKKKKGGIFGKKPIYEELSEKDSEEEEYYEAPEIRSVRDEEGPGSHGEEMDIDEFAQYACKYAGEIDCSITGKSMLALYERIEILEEDGVSLTRRNAEDLIEEAADRAEKPSLGKRIKGIFSSKYDKDGLLILKEEHFIY